MTANCESKSLVLIVGAGASKEVGLPDGNELKNRVSRILDIRYEHGSKRVSGDWLVDAAFRRLTNDINPYLRTGRKIAEAMPQAISIDNYIDAHRKDEEVALCGKLAIARAILEAESKSLLYVSPQNHSEKVNFSSLGPTWFNAFFQLLTENCQKEDLPDRLSRVAIISFNYDRCIEHYLYAALKNYYSLASDQATEILSCLEVHHPYGMVGKLPWQDSKKGFGFGAEPEPEKLLDLSAELRTFCEGVDPERSDIDAIQKTLKTSRRIAFLGFAFHRLNLDLLFPRVEKGQTYAASAMYATAAGISTSNVAHIQNILCKQTNVFAKSIFLRSDLLCGQFFHEFWRSLSLHN